MGRNVNVLEVCAGDIASVKAAAEGGALRVELCSALGEGGVTPSAGLIDGAMAVSEATGLRVHVLIRPRGGDFVYDDDEVDCMVADVWHCRHKGVHGVVIGALTPAGDVDLGVCRRLVSAAGSMSVTFHRAFDVCARPFQALEDIISLGCSRILTSGQSTTAVEGLAMLTRLREAARGRVKLLAGGGVTPSNVGMLIASGAVDEIHASARSVVESAMQFRNPAVSMGAPGSDEYSRKVTDADVVRALLSAF